jgi:O-antigen ligase
MTAEVSHAAKPTGVPSSPGMTRRGAMIERMRTVLGVCVAIQVTGLLFSIALSSIAFVLAAAAFTVLAVLRPREVFLRNGLEPYILALAGASALSVVFAVHPLESLVDARRLLLYLLVLFIPLAFDRLHTLRRFVLAVAVVAALHSAVEIVVYYTGAQDRLGFFQHYMTSAGIKMLVLLLVLPQALERGVARRERIAFAAASVVLMVALVLTQTRSSWIGFGVGMFVVGIVAYRSVFAVLAALVIGFVLLAPGGLMERVTNMFATQQGEVATSTVASNQYRMRMWETGWRMFLSDPLTGVGEGRMYEQYRTWVPDAQKDEGGHLHNTYVHILATHGAPGLVALLVMFAAVLRLSWRTWRMAGRSPVGALALGAGTAVIGFLVNGMAEYNFGDHEVMVLVWTAVGIVLAVRTASTSHAR